MIKSLRQSPLLKVLSLNSISVMVSFVLGVGATKIISVLLGAPGMVLLGSFRNFSSMFKSLATAGISNSAVKLVVENEHDREALSAVYSSFLWLFTAISAGLGIAILIFAGPISNFLFFNGNYTLPIRVFAVGLPLVTLGSLWIAMCNGFRQFKKIIKIQVVSSILVFGLTALMIWKGNMQGGLLSLAFGEMVTAAVTLAYIINDAHFRFVIHRKIERKYTGIIGKFSLMALLSAVVVPLTLMLIRHLVIAKLSVSEAGIWDGVNRLSGFYMTLFSSGLSLYYMPRLAALQSETEFKTELGAYFKIFVPLFLIMILALYFFKGIIINVAFTKEFAKIGSVLGWQLAGDFIRIMTLAFGYQILVKTMIARYFIIEIAFNSAYLLSSFFLMERFGIEGVLRGYFYANLLAFGIILLMFRKLWK